MRSSAIVAFCGFLSLATTPGAAQQERKRQEPKPQKKLDTPWKSWLNEEVIYIITDAEKGAFRALVTDNERERFVEEFWLRRNPTPDTVENEFRDEHYRLEPAAQR